MASETIRIARVTDLVVVAAGGRVLVDHVSVELPLPTRLAVMGANGAGKSVFLSALGGVIQHRGSVDVPEPVAAVLQDPESVFATSSVEEEIAFALACREAEAAVVRARTDAAMAALGLTALAGRDPATLSGGEQQRVQLAAAIVARPRTLLLDEPTEFLDAEASEEIEAALERLAPMPELVIRTTHDPERALACDRLIVLDGGRIVAFGDPAHVFARERERLDAWGIRPPAPLVVAEALAAAGRLDPPLPVRWSELETLVPAAGER